jgi:hypothetical protein
VKATITALDALKATITALDAVMVAFRGFAVLT